MFPFLILGLLLFFSYQFRWLKTSGLFLLFILGTFLILMAPITFWGMFAFMFIVSSSIKGLQKIYHEPKNPYEAKSSQRDGIQLLANGFSTLFFIFLGSLFPSTFPFYFAASCSLNTAFSDTLASEIGQFSTGKTFTLLGKRIEKGRSGGLSILGTIASLFGSFFMSIWWFILNLLFESKISPFWLPQTFWLFLLGFLGMLLDSLLGLKQGVYQNEDATITEKKTSQLISGKSFLTNDGVNVISQLAIGLLGLFLAFKFGWF